jgi:hypothetical protein
VGPCSRRCCRRTRRRRLLRPCCWDDAGKLDPPDEIADDWQVLIDGSRALAKVDPDDPGALEDLPSEVDAMGPASANVFRFLAEECGLDVSGDNDEPTETTTG